MKQAGADAEELIGTYRGEKQQEFNNKVLAAGGSGGSASAKLQAKTNRETQAMQAMFGRNAQKAVDLHLQSFKRRRIGKRRPCKPCSGEMRKGGRCASFEVLRSELRGTYRPCPCHTEDLQLIFSSSLC